MDGTILTLRPAELPLTETALCAWLGAATPGDSLVYHRGALARDICPHLRLLDETARARLAKLASRAWKLAEAGLADLVQRRLAAESFEYLIVARRRPRRVSSGLLSQLLAEAA